MVEKEDVEKLLDEAETMVKEGDVDEEMLDLMSALGVIKKGMTAPNIVEGNTLDSLVGIAFKGNPVAKALMLAVISGLSGAYEDIARLNAQNEVLRSIIKDIYGTEAMEASAEMALRIAQVGGLDPEIENEMLARVLTAGRHGGSQAALNEETLSLRRIVSQQK